MTSSPNTSLNFACGARMKNRFMLAPLTNTQSHQDGTLSDTEFNWLSMRAKGQFGLVMTCATYVQPNGKGFPGQLGIYSDHLIPGHQELTSTIQSSGSLAVSQLHHAGMRSPQDLIQGKPVCPSDSEKHGARALTLEEITQLKNAFIEAALRAQKSGYDGVEIHGAHGYILSQFLSSQINHRTDDYGGNLYNRSRLLFEIVDGIRTACGPQFLLGVRLSPERFGMDLEEVKTICQRFIAEDKIDFLDISLWDCFKMPHEEKYQDKSLLKHFTDLDFKNVRLTVAGKIKTGADVHQILEAGVDFITVGRSGILHHDFPVRVLENPDFEPTQTPVSEDYLKQEGLGEAFIQYMQKWPDFVS